MSSDALLGFRAAEAALVTIAPVASRRVREVRLRNMWSSFRFSRVWARPAAVASGPARYFSAVFPQSPALEGTAFGAGTKANAGVDSEAAVRQCENRIEVELRHLG